MYRVQHSPQFQVPTGGLGTYALQIRGWYCGENTPGGLQEATCLDSGVSSPRLTLAFLFQPHLLPP